MNEEKLHVCNKFILMVLKLSSPRSCTGEVLLVVSDFLPVSCGSARRVRCSYHGGHRTDPLVSVSVNRSSYTLIVRAIRILQLGFPGKEEIIRKKKRKYSITTCILEYLKHSHKVNDLDWIFTLGSRKIQIPV